VYFTSYVASAGSHFSAQPVNGEFPVLTAIRFDPYWSPIPGSWRAVPATVSDSVSTMLGDRDVAPPPATPNENFGWYLLPHQLNTWWYWVFPERAPRWLLVLVVPFLALAGWGAKTTWTMARDEPGGGA
jgi:hypothetical protein